MKKQFKFTYEIIVRELRVIIGVSKAYKNTGKGRKNHPRAKKYWKVYGYEQDEEGDWKYWSKFINIFQVIWYYPQIKSLQTFICYNCGFKFRAIKGTKPFCPACEDENEYVEEETEEETREPGIISSLFEIGTRYVKYRLSPTAAK